MIFSPQGKRKLLKFLKVFNIITFPLIVILFIICIIEDIPLKYILSFIVLYSITMTISLIFDTRKHFEKSIIEEHQYIFLAGINIVTYIIISLLINRYQLGEYRGTIYIMSLFTINIAYLEFHKKYISHLCTRIINNPIGKWIIRTIFLVLISGITIMIWNNMTGVRVANTGKTSSEVTGILSTIDSMASGEVIVTPLEERVPWESLGRYLGIGNSGEDVLSIQKYLFEKGYYTGQLSGNYDEKTAIAINAYIGDTTGEVFTRPEFGAMKLAFLRELSSKNINTPQAIGNEATGSISTNGSGGSIQINSIESMDSGASATIQDGKIVVQVVSTKESVSNSDNWEVQSILKNARGAGGLQGVVISAAKPNPAPGKYDNYQSITFSAEGASGIFFTADGSDPSCQGKGITKLIRRSDTITIKAISCYGGNKIRGPISSYTFMLNK